MPSKGRLTVAISTIGARAGRIGLPDRAPGIDYLVLVQRPDRAPAPAPRADLGVQPLDSLGVSASRNAALDIAGGDFLLFADDDVTLDLAGVERLRAALAADPGLAIVTGQCARARTAHGRGFRLRHWNCARFGTPEIMVRLAAIRAQSVRFDTDFGIGARHGLGEEFVFLTDALKAGLKGRHLPVRIGTHEGGSTGTDWENPANAPARLAVMSRVFGRAAPLARLGFALRNRRGLRHAPGGALGFVLGRAPGPPE